MKDNCLARFSKKITFETLAKPVNHSTINMLVWVNIHRIQTLLHVLLFYSCFQLLVWSELNRWLTTRRYFNGWTRKKWTKLNSVQKRKQNKLQRNQLPRICSNTHFLKSFFSGCTHFLIYAEKKKLNQLIFLVWNSLNCKKDFFSSLFKKPNVSHHCNGFSICNVLFCLRE